MQTVKTPKTKRFTYRDAGNTAFAQGCGTGDAQVEGHVFFGKSVKWITPNCMTKQKMIIFFF